jgi:hypothetical protein
LNITAHIIVCKDSIYFMVYKKNYWEGWGYGSV